MRKVSFGLLLLSIFSLFLLSGCGGGSGSSSVSSQIDTSQNGTANLKFNFKLPDGTNTPISSLRGATSPEVNFTVKLINPGDTETPVNMLKKTATVVDGNAEVVFYSLPLKPAICKVEIVGGQKGGYSKFRGAVQLTTSENVATVVPEGSKLKEDLMAGILEALSQNVTEFAKIDSNVISEIENMISNIVDTEITDEMAMMAFTNSNPEPVNVPTTRTVDESLSEPTNQLKVVVRESLATALDGFRTSKRPANANPVPSAVPVIGRNNQMNIGSMLQLLPELLPGGSTAVEMPYNSQLSNVATQTFFLEYSSNSIKFKKINTKTNYDYSSWPPNTTISTASIRVVTITGVNVEISSSLDRDGQSDGVYISGISTDSGWQATIEELDPETENRLRTYTVSPVSGFNFDIDYTRKYEIGTFTKKIYLWGDYETRSLVNYYSIGTQTTSINFNGTNQVNVSMQDSDSTTTNNFSLTLENLTGTFKYNQTRLIGKSGSEAYNTTTDELYYEPFVYGKEKPFEIPITKDQLIELPTFSNNQLVIKANGDYPAEGFELQNLELTLPNIVKSSVTDAAHLVDYSFSEGEGNVAIKYTGSQPELYGYIYLLQASISNLSFDTIPQEMGDGTQFVITKTSTDNTTNVLTYKIVNGEPVLQPVSQDFTGGSETITTDGSNTTIEGSVSVSDSDSTTASINYSTTKTDSGTITSKIDMTMGSTTQTIFFTRNSDGSIRGNFYLSQKSNDDKQNLLAEFSINSYGMGVMTYASGSSYSGTANFYLSL